MTWSLSRVRRKLSIFCWVQSRTKKKFIKKKNQKKKIIKKEIKKKKKKSVELRDDLIPLQGTYAT